jgi:hypothetical protein
VRLRPIDFRHLRAAPEAVYVMVPGHENTRTATASSARSAATCSL